MKIAVIKERDPNEQRVAVTPEVAKLYIKNGFSIWIEENAGLSAGYSNQEYINAGARMSKVPLEILSDANIVLKVQPSPLTSKINEAELMSSGTTIIGLLNSFNNVHIIELYKHRNITALSLELLPRISKTQTMDALSSQANLAGYRAVIEGFNHLKKASSMLMTAAGTVNPAKVLVLGAGVAGLQAIATAKRLGAIVYATDARASAKEQVHSVGGKFLSVAEDTNNETAGGYARETSSDYQVKQQILIAEQIKSADIVITTAQIPGKSAPILINESMITNMKPGAVVIDMASESGGNCSLTISNEIVCHNLVTIVGYTNYASKIAYDASKLYAKNLYNLVMYAFSNQVNNSINLEDEIIKPLIVTHNNQIYR